MKYELLPKFISDKGIISESGEIAWNKNNVMEAIEEIVKLNYAILGGDVWALIDIPKSNNPIDYKDIYVGIIPFKNGDRVCNWYSDRKQNENWLDFVLRSKKETLEFINESNIENRVKEELSDKIYYCLVFIEELGFNKLLEKFNEDIKSDGI
jgi:hypothetical protein